VERGKVTARRWSQKGLIKQHGNELIPGQNADAKEKISPPERVSFHDHFFLARFLLLSSSLSAVTFHEHFELPAARRC